MNTIIKQNTFIVLAISLCITATISHADVTLYVGPDKAYQSITAALAAIPTTLDDDYEIIVDVPVDGYIETGLDANVANFTLNGHTLIISGSAGGTIPTEVTYYMGDDIEYRQTSSSMVTIENISAGDEIARRTHSDGYFLNAPYEMFIKNHLGSTMTLVDENGQRVDAVYDYFPYGKQKIVASAPGAAKPVTQTYTGKELDLYTDGDVTGNDGEGRYYFGARYYDADVGRWISIDPVPQFFDLYNYCSNNPIKNIDPDGKEVEVQGTTKFKEATFASIGLMAKGQEGTDLWTQLYTSKNKFIIKETSGGNSFTGNFIQRLAMKLGIPTGGTVYYNPYKTTGGLDVKGSNIRPAFIGLGHELGHAYAADLGIQDFDMTLGVNGIPSAEQTSVFMEQMLRSENKLPLRQGY